MAPIVLLEILFEEGHLFGGIQLTRLGLGGGGVTGIVFRKRRLGIPRCVGMLWAHEVKVARVGWNVARIGAVNRQRLPGHDGRRSEELNDMTVGILEKQLQGAIGSRMRGLELYAELLQVLLPWSEVIDSKSEMIAAAMREYGIPTIANEMELLGGAKSEPGAGKGESGPGKRLEVQGGGVEGGTPRDIADVDGDVVELEDGHACAYEIRDAGRKATPKYQRTSPRDSITLR